MADRGLWARLRDPDRYLRASDLTPDERVIARKVAAPLIMLFVYVVALVAIPVCVAFAFQGYSGLLSYLRWVLIALWIVLFFGMSGVIVRRIRYSARQIRRLYGERNPSTVSELTESRREIVAAFEIERRRIERDLHDGAQQYLVTASMDVGEADLTLDSAVMDGTVDPEKMREVRRLLAKAQDDAEAALRALRHTVAGIHPKVLSDLGLESAVRDLAAASPLEVTVRCPHGLPAMTEGVIAAGYFMVSEALTNTAKHAPGARVSILLAADADLHISVIDDGPGGAVVLPDHGLAGMRERLAAFGGTFTVSSPPGGPTTVIAQIPLLLRRGEFGVSSRGVGEAL